MANSYLGTRSPKGNVGVRGVVDAGELSVYSQGVLSGFAAASVTASWTLNIGGVSGTQDVLVTKNPGGESELLVGTAGQAIQFTIGGAPSTPGQSRTDALVAYKNPSTTSAVNDGIDAVDYVVVAGTPATTGSQVPPSMSTIRTAIGALHFIGVIGYVTVAQGASSVTTGNFVANRSILDPLLRPIATADATTVAVATSQTTTSTSYADLATVGPSVTVTIGQSGKALLSFAATMSNTQSSAQDIIAVAISGATTIAASDTNSLQHLTTGAGDIRRYGLSYVVTGLTPGVHTFKLQYRVQSTGSGSGTGTFATRSLSVIPL